MKPRVLCNAHSGFFDMIKLGFGYAKDAVKFTLCLFAPSNVKNTFNAIRGMSVRDLIVGFFRLNFHFAFTLVTLLFTIFWSVPDRVLLYAIVCDQWRRSQVKSGG